MPITPHTKIEDLPQFLTVEEWRVVMRISRSLAYDLIRRGIVPAIRWGRAVRILREAVRKCVNQDGQTENSATPGDQLMVARDKSARWRALSDGAEE